MHKPRCLVLLSFFMCVISAYVNFIIKIISWRAHLYVLANALDYPLVFVDGSFQTIMRLIIGLIVFSFPSRLWFCLDLLVDVPAEKVTNKFSLITQKCRPLRRSIWRNNRLDFGGDLSPRIEEMYPLRSILISVRKRLLHCTCYLCRRIFCSKRILFPMRAH